MSERKDYSNYSSTILLSSLKEPHEDAISFALTRYRQLYLSYQQKCENTHPLYWYIFKHRKSINPIVIYKKMVYRKKIKEIRKIVFELMALEKTSTFQKMLNKNNNDYIIDIYTEAISDGYIENIHIK